LTTYTHLSPEPTFHHLEEEKFIKATTNVRDDSHNLYKLQQYKEPVPNVLKPGAMILKRHKSDKETSKKMACGGKQVLESLAQLDRVLASDSEEEVEREPLSM
jgi:hypothetical protein